MPLMIMSHNIQELDSPSRKRNHEEYSESEVPSKPDLAVEGTSLELLTQGLEAQSEQDTKMRSSEFGRSNLMR